MKNALLKLTAFIILTAVFKDALAADTASGSSVLPYETWLKTIQKSLTGPVAFSVSLIGIVSCGATLIFTGGEMGRFMRSIVYLVMVMTLLVGANTLMSSLFNGATIELSSELSSEHSSEISSELDPISNEMSLNDKSRKLNEKTLSDRATSSIGLDSIELDLSKKTAKVTALAGSSSNLSAKDYASTNLSSTNQTSANLSSTLIDSPKGYKASQYLDSFNDVKHDSVFSSFKFSFHQDEALMAAC